jgi:O-antigen ligase
MKKFVTTLTVVSLTGNIFPLLNILAISSLFSLFLGSRETSIPGTTPYGPVRARFYLLLACSYWLLSYVATGAPLNNLFSFEFLRYDGALLIAYLPLLFLTDFRLEPAFVRQTIGLFLAILSAVALLGLAEFVDASVLPLGLSALPEPFQLIHNGPLATDIFHGFFQAHNAAGAIYAMATLLAFALLVLGNDSSFLSLRAFWLGCNFIGLVLTQSRTAYVAFLITLLLVFFRSRKVLWKTLKFGSFILAPLLCFLLVQPAVNHRTEAVSNLEDPNVVIRFLYYQRAWNDFIQSPIVGTGFGRFNDELKVYSGIPHLVYFVTSATVVNDPSHAHNSYLHFLAEGGVLGTGLMLAVWISALRWVSLKKKIFVDGTFGYCLAQALQACIVLQFLMSMTEHMMGTAVSSLTIFTLLGLFLNLVGWKYRVASLVASLLPVAEEQA